MREVVPIRLGADERRQIARAADRLALPLSAFVRQAAIVASGRVEGTVVAPPPAPVPEPPARGVVVVEPREPVRVHFVDGEPVG